ncbi:MAG: histidine phosphatase family protein [Acidimicrobiia bacterium]|nr:histidine phosphatase family protein [Acidimicrobiia bacterium]
MNGPSTTEILALRHGQSTWNDIGRWQGRADPPLSEFGQTQALAAARLLGQVDVIVTSPLERAYKTAEIIAEHLGVGPVEVIEDLKERSIGLWEGLTRVEIEADWPGWIDDDRRPVGWEHDVDLQNRVVKAFAEVGRRYAGATVLLIAHGGVLIAMEKYLSVNEARIPNLHGRVFRWTEGRFEAGDELNLLPPDMRTGGRSKRL